jgi:hypothetical protein
MLNFRKDFSGFYNVEGLFNINNYMGNEKYIFSKRQNTPFQLFRNFKFIHSYIDNNTIYE